MRMGDLIQCTRCGVVLRIACFYDHTCDRDTLIEYQVFLGQDRFEMELASYLETSRGRFEQWYAATRRSSVPELPGQRLVQEG